MKNLRFLFPAFLAVLLVVVFVLLTLLPYVIKGIGFFLPMVVGNWPDPM